MNKKRYYLIFAIALTFLLLVWLGGFIFPNKLYSGTSPAPSSTDIPGIPTSTSIPTTPTSTSVRTPEHKPVPTLHPSLKVDICHATGEWTNPFVKITVVDGGTYDEHIYHDGDIIPAPAGGCPKGPKFDMNFTPNPTQVVEVAVEEVKAQLEKANIAFNPPRNMHIGDTTVIELLLNPSKSQSELAKELVERRGLVTSTANPDILFDPFGIEQQIETAQIDITNRMRATLKSLNPDAFEIQYMLVSEDQEISEEYITNWRWSITAKLDGPQTLELTLFRLIKINGKDEWKELKTYQASIVVEVVEKSLIEKIKSWDWQWIVGILVSVLSLPLFWGWYDRRRKAGIVIEGNVTGSSISTGDDPISIIGDGNKVTRVEKDHD